jgi:hypothetical protein
VPAVVDAWAAPATADQLVVFVNRTPVTGDLSVTRREERTEVVLFGCNLTYRCRVGRHAPAAHRARDDAAPAAHD